MQQHSINRPARVQSKRLHAALRPTVVAPSVPTTSASTRTSQRSSDTRPLSLQLDLWRVLLQIGSSKLADTFDAASDMTRTNAARIQRLVEGPPVGYPPGPVGDQAVSLISAPLDFCQNVTQQYGDVVGLLVGGERVVLVAGRETAKQVMVDQADVFVKKGTAFFPGSSLAGNGLLVSDGDVWRRQRRLSNPAFRRAAVETYAGAMSSATSQMLTTKWRPGQVRDVYVDFNELTLQITMEALFGSNLGGAHTHSPTAAASSLPQAPLSRMSFGTTPEAERIVGAIAKAFAFFTRRAGAAMMLPEWLPTWDNLEFGAAVTQLDKVIYTIIKERREQLAAQTSPHLGSHTSSSTSSPVRQDLLQTLLMATDEDGSGMSDTSLRDELMTLLVAGQETSAILLGWTCALLAHNPQVQDVIAAEVYSVIGPGRLPNAADIRSLPRTEAVVLEALRMYAPAYLVGRCASRDTAIGKWTVQAGTTILISPYLMHRDPDVWGPDVNQYNPDRWIQYQQAPGYQGFMTLLSGLGPNGSYMPFGAGPRNCIGTGFAMMEAILVLASIVQQYQLQPSPQSLAFPTAKPMITLRPEAVNIKLVARSDEKKRMLGSD